MQNADTRLRYPRILAPAIGCLSANLVGIFLYGHPRGSDELLSAPAILGAFLLFLSFLGSQICWGYRISKALRRPASVWEYYFFGSVLFAGVLSIAGFFPVIGAGSFALWNSFLLIGPLVAAAKLERRVFARFAFPRIDSKDTCLLAAGIIVVVVTVASSFLLHPFWDSLWYHLTGPRLWFDHASLYLPPTFPIAMKTGLWDYNFLWGHILLGGAEGKGLVAAQLFGQWASLAAALGCFAVLVSFRKLFSWSIASILLGIVSTELFALAPLAKNDWGSVFWSLAFLSFFLRRENKFLLGLAAGACFSAKYTEVFFLAPLLLWDGWLSRKQWKSFPIFAAGFVLAIFPVALRNFLFTQNPFFPALDSIFPTVMGPSWKNISFYEGITLEPLALWAKALALLADNRLCLGLPLIVALYWKLTTRQFGLLVATLSSLLLFFFCTGEKAEWRLAGAALVIASILGWRGIELAFVNLRKYSAPVLALTALIVLAGSHLDWTAPLKIWRAPNPSLQIRQFVSGSSMAWVRLHASSQENAATLNETRIYYLLPHAPIRAFDWPELDTALSLAHTPTEAVAEFRKRNIRYLVLSAEFLDLYYDRKICDWFYALSERNPQAVPFREDLSRVLDLSLLPTP